MSDIEVYVHDDELNQDVWKRVFIGGGTEKRICGLQPPVLTSESMQESALLFPGKVHKKDPPAYRTKLSSVS